MIAHPKQKRLENREFLDLIKTNEACLILSSIRRFESPCFGPLDPAHLETRGAGGGDHQAIVLCRKHHGMQGNMPIPEFAIRFQVNPWEEALRLIEKYCTVEVKKEWL